MPPGNAVDEKLTELSGRAKLKALIDALFGGWSGYARHRSVWPEHVRNAVNGLHKAEAIRQFLAEDLDLDRSEIDRLIDGEQVSAERSA
jgi:hypothetical protein